MKKKRSKTYYLKKPKVSSLSDYQTIVRLQRIERKIDALYSLFHEFIMMDMENVSESVRNGVEEKAGEKKNSINDETRGPSAESEESISDDELPTENEQKQMSGVMPAVNGDENEETEEPRRRRISVVRKKENV